MTTRLIKGETAFGDVMASMLALNVVDCGFEPKTVKLIIVTSPLSMQH